MDMLGRINCELNDSDVSEVTEDCKDVRRICMCDCYCCMREIRGRGTGRHFAGKSEVSETVT